MFYQILKKLLNPLFAIFLLVLSLPIAIPVLLVMAFELRGSPFFFQQRPGLKGKPFDLIKFKTMTNERDTEGNLLSDHMRMTRIGSVIRKLSLDEIPQLINVIKGDMAFIGPRPLLMEYLPLYDNVQARRHDVLPGITGWAQVNGRNTLSWRQKFSLDVYYVEHQSLTLDLKITFLTIQKVVMADGVNASDNVTMEPFDGTN